MTQKTGKIAVIGAGYVGLVTAACLAHKGYDVILVENDEAKRKCIRKGESPFFEPALGVVLRSVLSQERLTLFGSVQVALAERPTVVFSCVGTPSSLDGSVDLSYVWKVVTQVGMHAVCDMLFVHKSTVPVGVTRKTAEMLRGLTTQRGSDISIDVASNPEFLREGSAVADFNNPDRVVCGVLTERAETILFNIYKKFLDDETKFFSMDPESSELTKYAANAMLATRISFMNELARLSDKVGADIAHVERGVGSDLRIGSNFLKAGIGYGGSCLPMSVRALAWMGRLHNEKMALIKEVNNVNVRQQEYFIEKIAKHFGPEIQGKCAGVWGLAFKPGTDDVRSSPALKVISGLLGHGVRVIVYDSHVRSVKSLAENTQVSYAQTPREVLEKSDFLVILTACKEFSLFTPLDFALLSDRTVFDGRNCFDPCEMISHGVTYFCLGRNLFVKRRAGGREAGVPRVAELNQDEEPGPCGV